MMILKGLAIWSAAGLMVSVAFGRLVQVGIGSSDYDAEMAMLVSAQENSTLDPLPALN